MSKLTKHNSKRKWENENENDNEIYGCVCYVSRGLKRLRIFTCIPEAPERSLNTVKLDGTLRLQEILAEVRAIKKARHRLDTSTALGIWEIATDREPLQ